MYLSVVLKTKRTVQKKRRSSPSSTSNYTGIFQMAISSLPHMISTWEPQLPPPNHNGDAHSCTHCIFLLACGSFQDRCE